MRDGLISQYLQNMTLRVKIGYKLSDLFQFYSKNNDFWPSLKLIFSVCILPIHMVPTAKRFGNAACTYFPFVGHPCYPHKKVTLKKHSFFTIFSVFSIYGTLFSKKFKIRRNLFVGFFNTNPTRGQTWELVNYCVLKFSFSKLAELHFNACSSL